LIEKGEKPGFMLILRLTTSLEEVLLIQVIKRVVFLVLGVKIQLIKRKLLLLLILVEPHLEVQLWVHLLDKIP
jgi:hypothetical protein